MYFHFALYSCRTKRLDKLIADGKRQGGLLKAVSRGWSLRGCISRSLFLQQKTQETPIKGYGNDFVGLSH